MDNYTRRCLSSLARDIAKARAEREAKLLMHRLCGVQLEQREGFARIDTRAGCGGNCNQGRADCDCVLNAQMPGALRPRSLVPIQPAIQIFRVPLRKRLARRWQLLRDALVDPVIHS